MSPNHLLIENKKKIRLPNAKKNDYLTNFVLVLNTNNIPFAVPANTYLPEISNLATEIGDLYGMQDLSIH